MAERVQITQTCDRCAEDNLEVPATTQRPVPPEETKKPAVNDLCTSCGMLYDLLVPNRDRILAFLTTLPAMWRQSRPEQHSVPLARVEQARQLLEQAPEVPAPRPEPAVPPAPIPKAEPAAAQLDFIEPPETKQLKAADYIMCRDCRPAVKVPLVQRAEHARKKHGVPDTRLNWASGSVTLNFPCRKHDECKKHGYALHTAQVRDLHESKHTTSGGRRDAMKEPSKPAKGPNRASKHPEDRGKWVDGVDQVSCPLDHGPDAPDPYWIVAHSRTTHALKRHKLKAKQIPWGTKPDDPFQLNHPCPAPECNGYAFPDKTSLEMHRRVEHVRNGR